MYEWKIKVASNLQDLEKLVEEVQADGWTIEKIDVTTISLMAYRAKENPPQPLLEKQDEGHIEPDSIIEDRDYGQQSL